MESGASSGGPFWHALLKRRVTHRWGNFSWLSLNTLLQSGNDRIATLDASIVDTRRMRWVEAQRARGIDPSVPVRLVGARRLLALGDPGEMDPSQYVLVRDVAAAQPDVLLLMSDIVYPAGNIDAWRDAVYLPYLGLPASAWERAEEDAGMEIGIPPWHLFASPGNHDWYDGLTGFMFHACGAEPLPPVAFSSAGLTPAQRVMRRIWQEPARPNRRMLTPLRAAAAARWERAAAPGPMPWQPGPYFALDLGMLASGSPGFRILSVDTGIDGSIDVEQALWLREMLRGPIPKVVVTGKPLVVNDRIGDIPINRARMPSGDEPDDLPAGLRALLTRGDRVVATVAGDIHNSQRLVLAGDVEVDADNEADGDEGVGAARSCAVTIDAATLNKAKALQLPPVQIVAGGGGAYLSATHTTPLTTDDGLDLRGDDPLPDELPKAHHNRFPSREQSVLAFGKRAGRVAGLVAVVVGALVLAVALALAKLDEAGSQVCVDGSCLGEPVVIFAPFTLAGLLAALAWVAADWKARRRPVWWQVIGIVVALVLFGLSWWQPFDDALVLAGALAFALAAPVLPVLIPLLQTFPAFGRLVPLRTIAVALGGLVLTRVTPEGWLDHVAVVIALVAVAVLSAVFASWGVGRLLSWVDDLATDRRLPYVRLAFAVGSLWPVTFIVVAIFLLPQDAAWRHAREAAGMIVLIELLLLLAFLVGVAAKSVWSARRTAPVPLLWATVGSAVLCGALTVAVAWHATQWWLVLLLGAAAAVFGAAVTIGAALTASVGAVSKACVRAALEHRDFGGSTDGLQNRHLFRLMVVAAVPGISEIAESAEFPFRKSFLEISYEDDGWATTAIILEAFGVDEERSSGNAHPANSAPADSGSYLVDRLEIRLT